MSRTAAAALAAVAALALAACAQPGATAPSSSAPPSQPPTAAPTASEPAPSEPEDAWQAFTTQDGYASLRMPADWTVDDRSAMGEASEMHSTGPGWLNELVLRDADGDQMLWYREMYGVDYADCVPAQEYALEQPLTGLYGPELAEDGAEALLLGTVHEGLEADAGTWLVALGVSTQASPATEHCSGLQAYIGGGSRAVQIDVVADADAEWGGPDPVLRFGDEAAARAWFGSDEAATLVEVVQSIELSGAERLDAAP